ncbi:MAG: WYL domain-containing protein, partial [Actinomycetia bacterium]|nr:WYL domain-containing protein [Actinomycetes bacterium]
AVFPPRGAAASPACGAVGAAALDPRTGRCHYPRGAAAAVRRRLEPWGLVSWHGRWYVVGRDEDRAATRVFRLSRISGDVAMEGPAGSVVVPEGVDINASVRMLAQPATSRTARLLVSNGRAVPLRRQGSLVSEGAEGTVLDVPFEDTEQMASVVCAFGSAVKVMAPDDLKETVVRRLRATLDSVSIALPGGAS